MQSAQEPGVPLSHYLDHGAGVWLTCLDCMNHRELPLETVIGRLIARGVGKAATGIKEVARYVNRPCPRCGGRRFDTSPAFSATPKAAGWTAKAAQDTSAG